MISINSAIEIDITGQACADSIGIYQFSGVGGQMDFIRGASLSEGGIGSLRTNPSSSRTVNVCEGVGVWPNEREL